MRVPGAAKTVATALVLTTLAGCGKKGPPLAPLRLVPAAAAELSARRSGDDVELRFLLPTANANGPGPIDLAKIEVYAITIGPGAVTPPNRDLLTTPRVVGTIAVRPPPVEGEGSDTPSAPGAPPDTRPAPGDRVTFVDQLTAEKLKPIAAPNPATKSTGPGELKPVPPLGKPDPAAPTLKADPGKPDPGKAEPGKPEPGASRGRDASATGPERRGAISRADLCDSRPVEIRASGAGLDAGRSSSCPAGDAADRGGRADADRGRGGG